MAAPTIIPKSSYYDGVVTEGDRARGRAGAPDFTVYGPDELTLSAHPTIPFALVVKKGRASAYGVTAIVEALNGSDLVVQCDPNSSGTRWDIITIRYDWRPDVGGPSDIRAMNAGGKQLPSTLENTPGSVVDQPLWLARWTGNASAPAELIDLRVFAANGGMVVNDIVALNYLRKPGSSVKLNGVRYEFQPVGNGVWDWRPYPMAPTEGSYTPTWSGFEYRGDTFISTGRYSVTGKLVRVQVMIQSGANPSLGLAPISFTLPPGLPTAQGHMFTGDGVWNSSGTSGALRRLLVAIGPDQTAATIWAVPGTDQVRPPGQAGWPWGPNHAFHATLEYFTP